MSEPTTPVTPSPVLPTDPHVTAGTAATAGGRHAGYTHSGEWSAAAIGTVAAAALLIVAGAIQILEGISAVEADNIIVAGPQYTYQWTTNGWGLVHIVIGALLVVVGFALFTGRTWARAMAIVLASASIVANFLWLPHNPWWSILVIALDAFLIWAVATWHRDTPPAHAGPAS